MKGLKTFNRAAHLVKPSSQILAGMPKIQKNFALEMPGPEPFEERRRAHQGDGDDPKEHPDFKGLPFQPLELQPEHPPQGYLKIDGCFDGAIRVDGEDYKKSLFLCPQFLVQWNANCLEDITPEHLAPAMVHYPAIRHIFVGCGYTLLAPTPPEWVEYCGKYRVTVELCSFANAMRMFNLQNTLFQNFVCFYIVQYILYFIVCVLVFSIKYYC